MPHENFPWGIYVFRVLSFGVGIINGYVFNFRHVGVFTVCCKFYIGSAIYFYIGIIIVVHPSAEYRRYIFRKRHSVITIHLDC